MFCFFNLNTFDCYYSPYQELRFLSCLWDSVWLIPVFLRLQNSGVSIQFQVTQKWHPLQRLNWIFTWFFLYTLYYRAFYGKKDTLSNIPLYCNSFQKFSFSSDWVKYNILVLSINICLMLILFCLFVICWSICARIALKLWQMTSQPTRECGVCVANVRI